MSDIEEIVAKAYKKALNLVQRASPPDVGSNAIVVAAAQLTPLLLEVDLDERIGGD